MRDAVREILSAHQQVDAAAMHDVLLRVAEEVGPPVEVTGPRATVRWAVGDELLQVRAAESVARGEVLWSLDTLGEALDDEARAVDFGEPEDWDELLPYLWSFAIVDVPGWERPGGQFLLSWSHAAAVLASIVERLPDDLGCLPEEWLEGIVNIVIGPRESGATPVRSAVIAVPAGVLVAVQQEDGSEDEVTVTADRLPGLARSVAAALVTPHLGMASEEAMCSMFRTSPDGVELLDRAGVQPDFPDEDDYDDLDDVDEDTIAGPGGGGPVEPVTMDDLRRAVDALD